MTHPDTTHRRARAVVPWWQVLLAITGGLLLGSLAWGQALPKYYPPLQYPIGGTVIRLAKDHTCAPCEYGTVATSGSDQLSVDCDGACQTQLVCRLGSGGRDVVILALSPTDGEVHGTPELDCDTAWFQILTCTPTAQSPVCRVRAWMW